MTIDSLFNIGVAKSKSTEDYGSGKTPFVTNAQTNNGVVKYVEPFDDDKVFHGPAICISGLGHATVHLDKFLPKGNGGDSCTILTPKKDMTKQELLYCAALFNTLHRWRFTFGRKGSARRIRNLDLSPLFSEYKDKLWLELAKNNRKIQHSLKESVVQFAREEESSPI